MLAAPLGDGVPDVRIRMPGMNGSAAASISCWSDSEIKPWPRGCDGAGSLDLVHLVVDIFAYLVKADTGEVRCLCSQRVALRFH